MTKQTYDQMNINVVTHYLTYQPGRNEIGESLIMHYLIEIYIREMIDYDDRKQLVIQVF